MRSVPPRGSGWVGDRHANSRGFRRRPVEPTRYRVVVLTSCHVDDRLLKQSSHRESYLAAGFLRVRPSRLPTSKVPSLCCYRDIFQSPNLGWTLRCCSNDDEFLDKALTYLDFAVDFVQNFVLEPTENTHVKSSR